MKRNDSKLTTVFYLKMIYISQISVEYSQVHKYLDIDILLNADTRLRRRFTSFKCNFGGRSGQRGGDSEQAEVLSTLSSRLGLAGRGILRQKENTDECSAKSLVY